MILKPDGSNSSMSPIEPIGSYARAGFGFLTKHGKESVVAPLFREELDAGVVLVDSFDTDSLGTFTRDVPRAGSQLDAARRKANLAAELTGLPRGLGSEGSFIPGAFGMWCSNLEVVMLVDRTQGIEITGVACEAGHQVADHFEDYGQLESFAKSALFPSHGLVLRPNDQNNPRIFKDCADFECLRSAFEQCAELSPSGRVFVESDLRAHRNPTRMQTIEKACRDLLQRMKTLCPDCGRPGFGLAKKVHGLPCAWCGTPSNGVLGEEFKCPSCCFTELRNLNPAARADPGLCPSCNP